MKKSRSKGFSNFAKKSSNIVTAFRILSRFSDCPVYDVESLANSLRLAQSAVDRITKSMHLPRKTVFIMKKKRILLFLTEEYLNEVLIPEARSVLYEDKIKLSYGKRNQIERLFPLDCYTQSQSKSSLYSNSYIVSHDFDVSRIMEMLNEYDLFNALYYFSPLSVRIGGVSGNVEPDILIENTKKGVYLPIALEIVHSLHSPDYFYKLFRKYYEIHSSGGLFTLHIVFDEACFSDADSYIDASINIAEESLSDVPKTVVRKEDAIVIATDHLHIYLWKLSDALQHSYFSSMIFSQAYEFGEEGSFLPENMLSYIEQHVLKIVINPY